MRPVAHFLMACGALAPSVTAPVAAQESSGLSRSYVVGPGDVLSVSVYRASDYTTVVEVGEDGTVVLSLIGKVKVSELTPPQIGEEIARRLQKAEIFRNPIVNVMVQNYRSRTVSILGAVAKPGEYPLERGQMRISELLARSGAMLGNGGGTIQLQRRSATQQVISAADVLSGRLDPRVSPQDTLIVNQEPNFYISGEIQKAGAYTLEPGLTIGRAIAMAGGLSARGSQGRIKITRRSVDGTESTFKARKDEKVEPKDLIVIGSRLF